MLAAEKRRGTAAINPMAGSGRIDAHAADGITCQARDVGLRMRGGGMVIVVAVLGLGHARSR
jgi:hypothetical protein